MKALVVDDHPVTHVGCRWLLKEAGFSEVLDADNESGCLQLFQEHRPDFVVLDLGLPGIGGLSLLERLKRQDDNVRILIFSMHEDAVFAAQAIQTGANGYLCKSSHPDDFLTAVRTILAGKVYLSHEMATQLALINTGQSVSPFTDLTRRELQILKLVGEGQSHGEIADMLDVSYKTVANACTQLKSKLGARTHADLIRIAIEHFSKVV